MFDYSPGDTINNLEQNFKFRLMANVAMRYAPWNEP